MWVRVGSVTMVVFCQRYNLILFHRKHKLALYVHFHQMMIWLFSFRVELLEFPLNLVPQHCISFLCYNGKRFTCVQLLLLHTQYMWDCASCFMYSDKAVSANIPYHLKSLPAFNNIHVYNSVQKIHIYSNNCVLQSHKSITWSMKY